MSTGQRLCNYSEQNVSKFRFFAKHRNSNCQTPKYRIKVHPKQQKRSNPSESGSYREILPSVCYNHLLQFQSITISISHEPRFVSSVQASKLKLKLFTLTDFYWYSRRF